MSEELKPCPFCGLPAVMRQNYTIGASTPGFIVQCTGCGAEVWQRVHEEMALQAWNTRTIEDALTAERDAASCNLAAANSEIVDLYNALHDIVAETLAHDNSPYMALANIVKIASDALGVDDAK